MHCRVKGERREKEIERLVLYLCPEKKEFLLVYYFHVLAWEDVGKIFKACGCIYRHWRRFWRLWCSCNLHHTFLRAERAAWAAVSLQHLRCDLRTSFIRLKNGATKPISRATSWGAVVTRRAAPIATLQVVRVGSHKLCPGSWLDTALDTLQGGLAETLKQWLQNCSHVHILVTFIHYCWWKV